MTLIYVGVVVGIAFSFLVIWGSKARAKALNLEGDAE
jgi:hypothetical protein